VTPEQEPEPTPPITELAGAVPTSSVSVLAPEQSLAAISAEATDYIATRAPARGIAVITADEGLVYVENGDQQLETASVIKVVVMACTMHRAEQQGRLVDDWELSLMWPMITYSDNDATDALWYDLGGGPGITTCLQSIGATGITPYMGDYWGTSTASARGIATLMSRIAYGSVVNDVHRAVALEMLTNVIPEQRWGIPAGADGTGEEIVGVKDGWYPDDDGWRVNSVGFISPRTPGEQPYAIAVMTNNQATQEYGIETIEGLAAPVYDALRAQ
jgi:beta-lactamase class A